MSNGGISMSLNRIQKYRKMRGLTQKELAEKCGLATGTIQQYELGKRNPKIEQLQKISSALGVPLEYLIEPTTLNIGFMTERDIEMLEYFKSDKNDFIQSLLWDNNYTIIQKDNTYIIQKIVNETYGKKIKLSESEYRVLKNDINLFVKFLVEKLFDSHEFYFNNDN